MNVPARFAGPLCAFPSCTWRDTITEVLDRKITLTGWPMSWETGTLTVSGTRGWGDIQGQVGVESAPGKQAKKPLWMFFLGVLSPSLVEQHFWWEKYLLHFPFISNQLSNGRKCVKFTQFTCLQSSLGGVSPPSTSLGRRNFQFLPRKLLALGDGLG